MEWFRKKSQAALENNIREYVDSLKDEKYVTSASYQSDAYRCMDYVEAMNKLQGYKGTKFSVLFPGEDDIKSCAMKMTW